jgi:glucan 1,4-alpha-glucosidase
VDKLIIAVLWSTTYCKISLSDINFTINKSMMKKIVLMLLLCTAVQSVVSAKAYVVKSPNGKQVLTFDLSYNGEPTYSLNFDSRAIILPSKMGLSLAEGGDLLKNFIIERVDSTAVNNTWQPVWGEESEVRNNYKELSVMLRQSDKDARRVLITFRVFDDGIGFQYTFPKQANLFHFIVKDEHTEFKLAGDHTGWWLPGDYDTNEYPPKESKLSKVSDWKSGGDDEIFAKTPISRPSVQTPLMLRSDDSIYINIHEAALVNYSAMNLLVDNAGKDLRSTLVPDAVGNMAYMTAPCKTPWRTIIVGKKATDILASRIVLNLNEPTTVANPSYIKPTKYVGIWWEMHVGKKTWDYAGSQVASQNGTGDIKRTPHGATTAHAKKHIDFAAKHGFGGVLIEGWNTGWEDWFGKWKEDVFDFVTPYPDFDVQEVNRYARSKGVTIITHLETSGSITNFERFADTAFRQINKYGSQACKTGYVGKIIPRGEHHDGQWMVKHYERIAKKTRDNNLMLVAHEPVRPTGLHRTYPNWMACEAARGNEFNAWSSGNAPHHETILPFTRLVGGPMDYTPGIFTIKMNSYWPDSKNQVHTTLAKQLALYITLYSPVQMAADIIDNYEKKMDAFQFIKDVDVDWKKTVYLAGEPGDFVAIARQSKINENNWFVGAVTDENERSLDLDLSFLPSGKYVATIYADGRDASWDKNPESYAISTVAVTNATKLKTKLARGGGVAISIKPAPATKK